MSNQLGSRGWIRTATVAFAFALSPVAFGQDEIDPNNGYGPNDRPVFAFVSITEHFQLPVLGPVDEVLRANAPFLGSPMIRVPIGKFVAGNSIGGSRFLTTGAVTIDPNTFPPEPGTELAPDFDNNELTILGSFKTLAPDSQIHLMTPFPGEIDDAVQEAFFNASVFFEGPDPLSPFATTVETALFIYDHQGDADASIGAILEGVFHVDPAAPVVLDRLLICSSDGEIFPHDEGPGVFGFDFDFDDVNGVFDADVCSDIEVDVKPGGATNPINLGAKGVLPIAVLTTDDFDAVDELDPDTLFAVRIDANGEVVGSVAAVRFDIEDVDGDGDDDVTFKFRIQDLIAGSNAPLKATSTRLTFRGDTYDGACVQGSDSVVIVPKSKN